MIFGKKKREDIVDLRDIKGNKTFSFKNSKRQSEYFNSAIKKDDENTEDNLNFLGNLASSQTFSNDNNDLVYEENTQESSEEKRKKLAKRLLDMTNKIEDLSNQIYHLSQRIEVIEKKLKLNFD